MYQTTGFSLDGARATTVAFASNPNPRGGLSIVDENGTRPPWVHDTQIRVLGALNSANVPHPSVELRPLAPTARGTGADLPFLLLALAEAGVVDPMFILPSYGEVMLRGDIRPARGSLTVATLCAAGGQDVIIGEYRGGPYIGGMMAEIMRPAIVYEATNVQALLTWNLQPTPALPVPPALAPQFTTAFPSGLTPVLATIDTLLHNGHTGIVLIGPPGTGKMITARRVNALFPPPDRDEMILLTLLYDATGLLGSGAGWVDARPFRAPHHTVSSAGLVGGTRLGEIALASRGVLMLDELPEFSQNALSAAKTALRSQSPYLPRVVIGTMNPCPCGYHSSSRRPCSCSPQQVAAYIDRARVLADGWPTIDMITGAVGVLGGGSPTGGSTPRGGPTSSRGSGATGPQGGMRRWRWNPAGRGVYYNDHVYDLPPTDREGFPQWGYSSKLGEVIVQGRPDLDAVAVFPPIAQGPDEPDPFAPHPVTIYRHPEISAALMGWSDASTWDVNAARNDEDDPVVLREIGSNLRAASQRLARVVHDLVGQRLPNVEHIYYPRGHPPIEEYMVGPREPVRPDQCPTCQGVGLMTRAGRPARHAREGKPCPTCHGRW